MCIDERWSPGSFRGRTLTFVRDPSRDVVLEMLLPSGLPTYHNLALVKLDSLYLSIFPVYNLTKHRGISYPTRMFNQCSANLSVLVLSLLVCK